MHKVASKVIILEQLESTVVNQTHQFTNWGYCCESDTPVYRYRVLLWIRHTSLQIESTVVNHTQQFTNTGYCCESDTPAYKKSITIKVTPTFNYKWLLNMCKPYNFYLGHITLLFKLNCACLQKVVFYIFNQILNK